MFLSWAIIDWPCFWIWTSIFNAWSMWTPKFRAVTVTLTRDVPTVKVSTRISPRDQGAHTTKNSDLSSLNFNLLYAIQHLISETQDWSIIRVSSWEDGTFILKYIESWVSSAYICISTLYFRAISPIGEVYIVNNIGPNTKPCGTPYLRLTDSDVTPSITIHCNLSFRYKPNQPSDLSVKPIFDLRRSKRMSWSMVSNAPDNSSSTRNTPLPSSIALSRSFCTITSAVYVLW